MKQKMENSKRKILLAMITLLSNFLDSLGLKGTNKEELIDYYNDISSLAEYEIGIQFKNEGNLHAAIVMANIFSHSHKNLKIFAGNFNGAVSDTSIYLESLKGYIERGGDIEIIFEELPSGKSKALSILKEYKSNPIFKEKIKISIANQSSLKKYLSYLKETNSMVHFTIGDDKMYRCELDTTTYKALCNFDDKKFSANLNQFFTILKIDAKPFLA